MVGSDCAVSAHKPAGLNGAGSNTTYKSLIYIERLEDLNHFDMVQLHIKHVFGVCRGCTVYRNALRISTHSETIGSYSVSIICDGRTCYIPDIIAKGDIARIEVHGGT